MPGRGSLPLEAVPDAREKKKTRIKGIQIRGRGCMGAERAEREKGVKNAKNGRKGYPNRYDQNSIYSHAIKRGKGR